MEIKVLPPDLSNADCWIVTVDGYGGDADSDNQEVVYCGKNADIAKRTLIEALALAAIFPNGRGGSKYFDYSHILASAVSKTTPDEPFFWAATEAWSWDATCDHYRDATIEDARISFIDSQGRERATEISLSSEETAFIGNAANLWMKSEGNIQRTFNAQALVSGIQELIINQSIPPHPATKRKHHQSSC